MAAERTERPADRGVVWRGRRSLPPSPRLRLLHSVLFHERCGNESPKVDVEPPRDLRILAEYVDQTIKIVDPRRRDHRGDFMEETLVREDEADSRSGAVGRGRFHGTRQFAPAAGASRPAASKTRASRSR